jgi:fatty-acyl-CoA synthase
VAAPDERLGEIPVAFVRLFPGASATSATSADLDTFCRERLAGYKVPRHIVFVDGFPVSGSGKVERFKLREQASRITTAGGDAPR